MMFVLDHVGTVIAPTLGRELAAGKGDKASTGLAPDDATTTMDDAMTTKPDRARRKILNMMVLLTLIEMVFGPATGWTFRP